MPTRGEGWGRVAQEAMSCGVPVITTGYGGPLTFINEENAFPIPIQGYVGGSVLFEVLNFLTE